MAVYSTPLSATGYVLHISAVETSTNVSNNTSQVAWQVYITRGSGTGKWSNYVTYWSANIAGVSYSGSRPNYDFRTVAVGDAIIWASGTTTVAHNPNGTGSAAVSGSFSESVALLGSGTASGTLTLSTIPRASSPTYSPSPVDIGSTVTINTNRASGTFTHDIDYSFGALSGSIGTGIGASTTWLVPTSLMAQIPSNTSGSVTITTKTYNGATLIGTTSTSMLVAVPASVVPDFTTVTNSETVSVVATEIGGYVQGLSRLALAITGAVGVEGSTITSYKIEVAGQTINSASGTMPAAIANSGTVPIVGTITDSRGRTRSKTVNVTVLPYAPPLIDTSVFQVRRADVSGVPDEEGGYVRVDLKASVSSLIVSTEKNALTYKLYSRERGDTTWNLDKTVTPGGVSFNSNDTFGPFAVEQAWEILVVVSDKFASAQIQSTIATAEIFMHWAEDGLGIGKFWERGAVDIKGQAYQNDGNKILDETFFATSAETIAGVEDDLAVTPSSLAALTGTTARRGLVELATLTEAKAGTDTERAVTPQGLIEAIRSGRQGRIPSSVVIGSGSASVAADGTISFTGVSRISLNDVFDGAGMDCYEIVGSFGQSAVSYVATRMRAAGVDDTSSSYVYTATLTSLNAGPTRNSSSAANIFGFWNTTTPAVASPSIRGNLRVMAPAVAGLTTIEMSSFVVAGDRFVWHESSNAPGTGVYDGFTILAGSGTLTGFLKVVKIA